MFGNFKNIQDQLQPGDKMVMQFQRNAKPSWLQGQTGNGNGQAPMPKPQPPMGPPPGGMPPGMAPGMPPGGMAPAPEPMDDQMAQRQMLLQRMQQMGGSPEMGGF
jgi:hypothetical protein